MKHDEHYLKQFRFNIVSLPQIPANVPQGYFLDESIFRTSQHGASLNNSQQATTAGNGLAGMRRVLHIHRRTCAVALSLRRLVHSDASASAGVRRALRWQSSTIERSASIPTGQHVPVMQHQMHGQHPLLRLRQWNVVNPIVAELIMKLPENAAFVWDDPAAIEAVEMLQQHALATATTLQRKPRKHWQKRQSMKPQLRALVQPPTTPSSKCFWVLLDMAMTSSRMKYTAAMMAFILPDDPQLWARFDTQVASSCHLLDDEALLLASNALLTASAALSLKQKIQAPLLMAEKLQSRDPILRSLQQVTAVMQPKPKLVPPKGRPLKANFNFDDIVLASAGDKFTDSSGWLPMVLWTVAHASERGTHDFKSARARVTWLAAEHLRNSNEIDMAEIQSLVQAAYTHDSIHWPNGYEFFQTLFDKATALFQQHGANVPAAQLLEVLELMERGTFKHLGLVNVCTELWVQGIQQGSDSAWRDQVHRMVNVLIKTGHHDQAAFVFKSMLTGQSDFSEWRIDRIAFDRDFTNSTERWLKSKGGRGYSADDLIIAVPALHRAVRNSSTYRALEHVENEVYCKLGLFPAEQIQNLQTLYSRVGRRHPLLTAAFDDIVLRRLRANQLKPFEKIAALWLYAKTATKTATAEELAHTLRTEFHANDMGPEFSVALWSMAVLELLTPEMYNGVMEALVSMSKTPFWRTPRSLQMRNQLAQVQADFALRWSLDVHTDKSLWTPMAKTIVSEGVESSKMHKACSAHLSELGIPHRNEAVLEFGYLADMFIEAREVLWRYNQERHKAIVVEVDGPTHFDSYSQEPLGKTKLKRRHLEMLGYRVISIPVTEFQRVDPANRLGHIQRLLGQQR